MWGKVRVKAPWGGWKKNKGSKIMECKEGVMARNDSCHSSFFLGSWLSYGKGCDKAHNSQSDDHKACAHKRSGSYIKACSDGAAEGCNDQVQIDH